MSNTKYSEHQFFYFPFLILTKNLGSKKTLFMRRERLQCSGLGFGYRAGNLSKLWISRKADYLKEWIIHYLRTKSLSHWFTLSLAGQISLFVDWPRHAIISPCSSIGFLLRGWYRTNISLINNQTNKTAYWQNKDIMTPQYRIICVSVLADKHLCSLGRTFHCFNNAK